MQRKAVEVEYVSFAAELGEAQRRLSEAKEVAAKATLELKEAESVFQKASPQRRQKTLAASLEHRREAVEAANRVRAEAMWPFALGSFAGGAGGRR